MTGFSALSPTQAAVVQSVTHFRQLTTSQIRRLHYSTGTPDGRRVRSCRHLARLVRLGYLKRFWGAYNGYNEYVYQLASAKARTPEPHTLDISELWVELVENHIGDANEMVFLTEPWCHTRVGHVQLKPDGYIEVGGVSYFLELDTGVEWESQLTAKCRRYVQAIDSGAWPEDRAFPKVIWTVPSPARRAYLENVIHKLKEEELFGVVLFEEAANEIMGKTIKTPLQGVSDSL